MSFSSIHQHQALFHVSLRKRSRQSFGTAKGTPTNDINEIIVLNIYVQKFTLTEDKQNTHLTNRVLILSQLSYCFYGGRSEQICFLVFFKLIDFGECNK